MSDSKKKVRRATNPVVETLESRQLMSVTVIDMGGSGDYLVQGTTGDDSFTVSVNQVTQAFTVAGNTYTGASLIEVDGYDGDDTITVSNSSAGNNVSAKIYEGNGTDTVTTSLAGSIECGDGNDSVTAQDVPGALAITTGNGDSEIDVNGDCVDTSVAYGNGVNTVEATLSNYGITVYGGGDGSDVPGQYNLIDGSAYADTIFLGKSYNLVNCYAGDDVIYSGGNGFADTVRGGMGTDTAYCTTASTATAGDPADSLSGVENVFTVNDQFKVTEALGGNFTISNTDNLGNPIPVWNISVLIDAESDEAFLNMGTSTSGGGTSELYGVNSIAVQESGALKGSIVLTTINSDAPGAYYIPTGVSVGDGNFLIGVSGSDTTINCGSGLSRIYVTGSSWDSRIDDLGNANGFIYGAGNAFDLSVTASRGTDIRLGGVNADPSGVGATIHETGGAYCHVDGTSGDDAITVDGGQKVDAGGGDDTIWCHNGVYNYVDGGGGTNTCHDDIGLDKVINASEAP